eukprot:scaffold291829_cov24-Tisochrysis_lutea.AAC.1
MDFRSAAWKHGVRTVHCTFNMSQHWHLAGFCNSHRMISPGKLSHESLQPPSKPGSPSEQSVKPSSPGAPEGAVPPLKIPPKQAHSRFANAKRPPSAFHASKHKV